MKDYTMRQLMLYYRECVRADSARLAEGIISANLGFTGGEAAQTAIRKLSAG